MGKKVLIEPDVAKRVLLEPIACPALTRWSIFRDSEKSDQPYILLWQPATLFFNLVVLVPLGCIFRTKAVPVGKSIIAAILIVLVCESLQYVCKLGIFDVIDVVSHVIGFIFGFYLADALIDFGLHFSAVNEHICSLTRKN
ncbi:VanZ family protein [Olegusella massiliensis]|uniref:VanZ family protein n=1 Tax=Olegusella massiliensis TaxID=1776381 RepID=UPI001651D8C4|nr:VanZ family protein [Olegusella massiliensis]